MLPKSTCPIYIFTCPGLSVGYGSGHEGAPDLFCFAIKWKQNQVTRQAHLDDLTHMSSSHSGINRLGMVLYCPEYSVTGMIRLKEKIDCDQLENLYYEIDLISYETAFTEMDSIHWEAFVASGAH